MDLKLQNLNVRTGWIPPKLFFSGGKINHFQLYQHTLVKGELIFF